MIMFMIKNDHERPVNTRLPGSCSMFLTMGSLGDWISLTGERISTTSELGVAHISPPEGTIAP